MDVSGFVLAGGKSTRMGKDKALLEWHGRTLLEHMVQLVGTVTDPVRVVGRDELPDLVAGLGPLSGIATGLENSFTDGNLFVAVDMPLLTSAFLKHLRSCVEHSSHPLLACKIGSVYPLCLGVWRPMLPEIKRRLSSHRLSVRALIEESGTEVISEAELLGHGFEISMFENINTEEDYRSLL
jgi:molybdopterin-guanine dinucleotide biosynthesis protein A